MNDIAVLGISTQMDGVVESDRALDNLASTAGQAQGAMDRLSAESEMASTALLQGAVSARQAAAVQTQLESSSTQASNAIQRQSVSARAAQAANTGSATAAQAATAANNQLAGSLDNVADSSRRSLFRVQNLGFQINDIGSSIATGQGPLRVFIQQGAQILQLYAGQGGVNLLLSDFNRILLGTGRAAINAATGILRFATGAIGGPLLLGLSAAAAAFIFFRDQADEAARSIVSLEDEREDTAEILERTAILARDINLRRIGEDAEFAAQPINQLAGVLGGVQQILEGTRANELIQGISDVTGESARLTAQLERLQKAREAATAPRQITRRVQDPLNPFITRLETQTIRINADTTELDQQISELQQEIAKLNFQSNTLFSAIDTTAIDAFREGFSENGFLGGLRGLAESLEKSLEPPATTAEQIAQSARDIADEKRRQLRAQNRINAAARAQARNEERTLATLERQAFAAMRSREDALASGNVTDLEQLRLDRQIANIETARDAAIAAGNDRDQAELISISAIEDARLASAFRIQDEIDRIDEQARQDEIRAQEIAAREELQRVNNMARAEANNDRFNRSLQNNGVLEQNLSGSQFGAQAIGLGVEDELARVLQTEQDQLARAQQIADQRLDIIRGNRMLELEVEREHAVQVAAIQRNSQDNQVAVIQQGQVNRFGLIANAATNAADAIEQAAARGANSSRAAARIQQAAAFSSAIVNTAAGVVQALNDPLIPSFPVRVANAVAAGALGASQIAAIAAQGGGGGGSVPRVSGFSASGGGSSSTLAPSASANIRAPQNAIPGTDRFGASNDNMDVTINITNNTSSVVTQSRGPNGEIEFMIEEAVNRVADQMATGVGPVADQLRIQTGGRAVSA